MDSRNRNVLLILVAGVLLLAAAIMYANPPRMQPVPPSTTQATTTDKVISDGTISFTYADTVFGLATNSEQIIVKAYIPPCNTDFNYCFYYVGTDYQGTNFESAGVRVQKRVDLATQTACLKTLPEGYTNITPKTSTSAEFATSVIAPLGDAGAGHYANGALYRLAYKGSCYEFETRIGETQYANYPRGTIKEFMPSDQRAMNARLLQLLKDMTLPGGAKPFAKIS